MESLKDTISFKKYFQERCTLFLIICILLNFETALADTNKEQLIIFIQKPGSKIDQVFQKQLLPKIQNMAMDSKLPVKIINVNKGVPPEIKITPLIVYENHLGRSIYQGRSTTVSRIRNFIRTSRFLPQGKDPLIRNKIPIWKMGRTRVWAPLKIASVSGTQPQAYNDEQFKKEALEDIYKGFQHFHIQENILLERADRGFYMDFYPWLSQDKTLFLSLAVFSQFHCKEPVFHTRNNPLVGSWENRKALFQKAASLLETIVFENINDPNTGDGFNPIKKELPIMSWKELGLSLPPPPEKTRTKKVNAELPTLWALTLQEPDNPPLVLFHFPAPLDRYTGEATRGTGLFELPENRDPSLAKGSVVIDPSSVSMGQRDLDKVIQSSLMLHTKKYPISKFEIQSGEGDNQKLRYGSLTPVRYHGLFTMKGKTIPLTAVMEIEPVLSGHGEPLLIIKGGFKIDLNHFGIDGPDGPKDISHTVIFDVNFALTPKSPKSPKM